jgi:hypothetical protein
LQETLSKLFSFDVASIRNQLFPIAGTSFETDRILPYPFSISIGQFDGRREPLYSLKNSAAKFFAFVVARVFEVEGRVLHEKMD